MAFNELIKNFDNIRQLMRDFYVFGFKSRADFQIDTFMPYEVPVYKNCLENKLTQVRDRLINNDYYKNIVEFFRFILPMSEKNVPETWLIREFIG